MNWQRSMIAVGLIAMVGLTASCRKRDGTTTSDAAKASMSPPGATDAAKKRSMAPPVLCVDGMCAPLVRQPRRPITGPAQADSPVAFGYKCLWLAVKTAKTQAVVKALGLSGVRRAGWKTGIEYGYGQGAFVAPPVKGWTLVVSVGLPSLGWPADKNKITSLLQKLSQRFGEVQYYATHRVSEFHAWAVARKGVIVRQFAWVGDQGRVSANTGAPLPEEKRAKVVFTDLKKRWPKEQDVMVLAGVLSINPTKLNARSAPKAIGFIGKLP